MHRYSSIPRARVMVLIGALAVAVALGGCSGSASKPPSAAPTSTSRSSTVPATTTTETTSTTSKPSAAGDLADYFAAVANDDHLLKVAAAAVNSGIGTTQIIVEQSTLDAIEAENPATAATKIPPGLTPSVLLPAMTVQSDLISRYFSLRGIRVNLAFTGHPGTFPISDSQARDALGCLRNGAPAAAALSADIAAARAAATAAPPVGSVGPASQSAAEVAARVAYAVGENSGSLGCGGTRVTTLVPVTWQHTPPVQGGTTSWDGAVAGVALTATYRAGSGWNILIHAN